jgi:hypothetical protein
VKPKIGQIRIKTVDRRWEENAWSTVFIDLWSQHPKALKHSSSLKNTYSRDDALKYS